MFSLSGSMLNRLLLACLVGQVIQFTTLNKAVMTFTYDDANK